MLQQHWPATVSFGQLCQTVGPSRETDPVEAAPSANLKDILLEAYRSGVVEFWRTPVPCSRSPRRALGLTAGPLAKPPGQYVTTLRYENLRLEDGLARQFLQWVDGTRTVEQLQTALDTLPRARAGG